MENHHVSRHYLNRNRRSNRYRRWVKLTVVSDNASHLITGSTVGKGPSNDCVYLPEAISQAASHLPIKVLLADAGYDSENNHRFCREELGIPSTVIPVNKRNRKNGGVVGRYRQQMAKKFPKAKYHQRWQVESVMSRMKRRLGSALRSRSNEARTSECRLLVLTYDLMFLYALFKYNQIQKVSTEHIQF